MLSVFMKPKTLGLEIILWIRSADIDSLQFFGGIHPVRSGRYCLLATRFPYAIYYQIVNHMVHVQAVLDCRRNPSWIKTRLK